MSCGTFFLHFIVFDRLKSRDLRNVRRQAQHAPVRSYYHHLRPLTLGFVLCLTVCLIYLATGLTAGWVAPTLSKLKNSTTGFSLTVEECSWVASLHYITRTLGPILSAALVNRIGHRPMFITISCIYFVAWVTILTTRSVFVLYIVRLAFGLGIGMIETTASIYIGENCSPKVRGRFNGIFVACMYGGLLLALILATYLPYDSVALAHAGLSCAALFSTILLKEPAQYLIMKGKLQQAEKTFFWLRDIRKDETRLEFEEIKQHVVEEKSAVSFSEVFSSPEVYKTLRIVFLLNLLMYSTGFAAVISFVTMTFSSSSYLSAEGFTIIFGGFQLISCCGSSFIMDKFNRRTLWHTACILTAGSHAGTAALYYAQKTVPYFEWFLFATVTIYSCVFGMLMLPLASAARGELLPQRVKAIGNCLAVVASSITGFGTSRVFLPIAEAYGMQTNFVLFSIMCLIIFAFEYFDLPETRGVSLVKIQKSLKKAVIDPEPSESEKLYDNDHREIITVQREQQM